MQQGMLRQHELMHDLARVGPATLDDVVTTKPNAAGNLVKRKCPDGVWTCDDMSGLVPDVPVKRQFPTKASLVDAAFRGVAEREFYQVKRDGAPEVVVMVFEPTFDVLAKNIRFRYLAKHGRDSNTVIIVVQSWLRPLDR